MLKIFFMDGFGKPDIVQYKSLMADLIDISKDRLIYIDSLKIIKLIKKYYC